jgi:23S rRNA pseudouridine2605 synthase
MTDPVETTTEPVAPPGAARIAKVLARAGVASRREVERLIGAGRVSLNGAVLTTPAALVGPGDVVALDGAVIGAAEPTRLFLHHKPVGLVTTHKDPKGRPTVFEALPAGLPRLISVGRLDLNSEGLLLLTNDGALARALELPGAGWKRRYRVRARGKISQEKLDTLKEGITVEGVVYGAIEARLDKAKGEGTSANLWLTVILTEGKNREVRKVLAALGLTVNRLIRQAYGPFALGTLEKGAVEEVSPRVIREQLGEFIAPESLPANGAPLWRKPTPGAASAPKPKKVYKAGWAKPKVGKAVGKPHKRREHRGHRDADGAAPGGPKPKAPRG